MSTPTTTACAWWLASALALAGCPGEDPPVEADPLVAGDWATSYQEVRDCRRSGDHDLNYVRVLADAAALSPYVDRDAPFPVGAVVVKAEYADEMCSDLTGFTAMKREAAGYDPTAGDWHWQKLGADRQVKEDGKLPRCISCHEGCGVPPDGHDWTCAVP